MRATVTHPLPSEIAIPDDRLLVEALFNATRAVRARLRPELEREGVSGPMFWALNQLVTDGPMNVGRLAGACVVTPAIISAAADGLVAAGLVMRQPASHDRRVVVLAATAKGRALHRAVWSRLARTLVRTLGDLPPSYLHATARVLERFAATPPERPVLPASEAA